MEWLDEFKEKFENDSLENNLLFKNEEVGELNDPETKTHIEVYIDNQFFFFNDNYVLASVEFHDGKLFDIEYKVLDNQELLEYANNTYDEDIVKRIQTHIKMKRF
ncbi:hypothetical protein H5203_21285 [Pseudoalteromonas sp. SG41-1]|uniref:hypothetical protein n=1 Tax=Pseudoalteromonas sp. SG41-1 TaxID=2760979 RepID=UPI0016044C1A|nr:hypothetical protein [Pseudoalteromonas sp. SG41-1]MBB1507980.1 hypothetical protein [Pseudoalteromonas sp. SG41-1]